MTSDVTESLAPLRHALLRRAQAAADATRSEADRQARALVAAAEQESAALLARARADGEEDAAQLQTEDRGRSRRAAREIVLAAQRAVYDALRTQAQTAVHESLADPAQQRRLREMVGNQLGPQAQVSEAAGGGLVGSAPDGRRVDASVPALVERALNSLDLEPLWASP
jgi:hypothetical protein